MMSETKRPLKTAMAGKAASLSRRDCLSTILMGSASLMAASYAGPVWAQQRINHGHVINLAGRQRMLSQRMTKEVMLIALQHDVQGNVQSLETSQQTFKRVLRGLRHGDRGLALPALPNSAVREALDRVDDIWLVFESQVEAVIAAQAATQRQLNVISDTNLSLLRMCNEVVKTCEDVAMSHSHSMLAYSIDLAGIQRMLSQRISKELYAVALDINVSTNRQYLRQSAQRFEQVHIGLISGNPELFLLPAPTQEIRDQLTTVHDHWDEFTPMILDAADGVPVTDSVIARSAELNLSLLEEMEATVLMYEALHPRQSIQDGQSDTGDGATS